STQRSSQGYTFSLGSGSVSWRSTRSSSVLGSSCEAEIYAGAMAAQELRWLTYLLTDLGEQPRSPPVLYANTADIFTKALPPGDHQRFCTMLACFALLDWSCDLLFSPTLPMGVFLLVPNSFASSFIPHSFTALAKSLPRIQQVGISDEAPPRFPSWGCTVALTPGPVRLGVDFHVLRAPRLC
ncbi:unnamed protein product, partial [Closterium sp. NIES-53]